MKVNVFLSEPLVASNVSFPTIIDKVSIPVLEATTSKLVILTISLTVTVPDPRTTSSDPAAASTEVIFFPLVSLTSLPLKV